MCAYILSSRYYGLSGSSTYDTQVMSHGINIFIVMPNIVSGFYCSSFKISCTLSASPVPENLLILYEAICGDMLFLTIETFEVELLVLLFAHKNVDNMKLCLNENFVQIYYTQ